MSKYIETINTDKVELEVVECKCGFHLGIDATYLDQVGVVSIQCPSCPEFINTKNIPELSNE